METAGQKFPFECTGSEVREKRSRVTVEISLSWAQEARLRAGIPMCRALKGGFRRVMQRWYQVMFVSPRSRCCGPLASWHLSCH